MLRVIELFAGIGSQAEALKRLGIDHKVEAIVEWDKYAYASYEAIHGKTPNLGDITKVDKLPECDLLTYSFPCQDLSVAGKGAGIKEGTRSGLLLEVERLLGLYDKKPRYLLLENVKNLVGKQHKPDFDRWLGRLEEMGYNNYWKVLNAKHYGVPQNRERVFVVSILKEYDYGTFKWPEPFDNGLRLKDFLESDVDEKYYIDEEKASRLIMQIKDGQQGSMPSMGTKPLITHALGSREHRSGGWREDSSTLCARDYKDPKVVAVPCITPDRVDKRQNGRRFKEDGDPMFTLTGQDRHGVLVKANNSKGYDVAEVGDTINFENLASTTRRGRVGKGVAQTINTMTSQGVVIDDLYENRPPRVFDECPTLRADRQGLKTIEGVGHHPFSKKLEFDGYKDGPCPTLLATDYKAPKTVLESTQVYKCECGHIGTSDECEACGGMFDGEWVAQTLTTSCNQAVVEPNKTVCLNSKGGRSGIEGLQPSLNDRIYDSNGIYPAITTSQFFMGNIVAPNECDMIGHIDINGHDYIKRVYSAEGIAPTVPTGAGGNHEPKTMVGYRIRKLTPKECWRLMGQTDEAFEKAASVVSNSQLYKQAGNSIVVDVLEYIFDAMITREEDDWLS